MTAGCIDRPNPLGARVIPLVPVPSPSSSSSRAAFASMAAVVATIASTPTPRMYPSRSSAKPVKRDVERLPVKRRDAFGNSHVRRRRRLRLLVLRDASGRYPRPRPTGSIHRASAAARSLARRRAAADEADEGPVVDPRRSSAASPPRVALNGPRPAEAAPADTVAARVLSRPPPRAKTRPPPRRRRDPAQRPPRLARPVHAVGAHHRRRRFPHRRPRHLAGGLVAREMRGVVRGGVRVRPAARVRLDRRERAREPFGRFSRDVLRGRCSRRDPTRAVFNRLPRARPRLARADARLVSFRPTRAWAPASSLSQLASDAARICSSFACPTHADARRAAFSASTVARCLVVSRSSALACAPSSDASSRRLASISCRHSHRTAMSDGENAGGTSRARQARSQRDSSCAA